MKIALAVLLLLAASAYAISAATDVPRLAITSPEKTSMKDDLGKENPKWKFVAGKWTYRPSGGRQVLAQVVETQPWAVAILEDKKFGDVDVTVRFRPISGKEDASGGIIFRAKDAKNYYLVRANGLEDNFRLYAMKEGSRNQLASTKVDPPKLGEWHTMRVVAKGTKIQAYLDGKLQVDH